MVATLKHAIDDARHAAMGYRRLAAGPEAQDEPPQPAERALTRR